MLTLFYFILAILLLVSVHEYGHFLAARFCGVKVLRFSIGFGPVLWRWFDRQGTEYAVSLLPLGGYVKMLDETEAPVEAVEKPFAFNNQPLYKRTSIVFAGPLFNFLFAFLAFWLVLVIGMTMLAPMVGQVKPGSPAEQAGISSGDELLTFNDEPVKAWRDFQMGVLSVLGDISMMPLTVKDKTGHIKVIHLQIKNIDAAQQDILGSLGITPYIPKLAPVIGQIVPHSPGENAGLHVMDRILRLNGKPVKDWLSLVDQLKIMPNKTVAFEIKRAGYTMTLPVRIGTKKLDGQTVGFLGLMSQKPNWPAGLIRTERETPWGAIPKAFKQTIHMTRLTVELFVRLVTGRIGMEHLSGPVGIAQSAGESGRGGLVYYLSFLALVSISLGVINLLPIPILDGGHLFYYAIEWLRRKPVSVRFQTIGNMLGLSLLIALMVFSLVNDVTRLFG